ncbi:MAG: glycosyltransferase family 2 protein [Candidatus Levybacteria bacterium]|nr:glycosyltransferase family 2 protein [Candidatus Levybacteria bacterium]
MNLSIIIPNYNGEVLLKKNLPRVIEAAKFYHGDVEIIIVDDASTDESISTVSNLKPQISNLKLIKNERNLGFARSVNRGVEDASGDILVLLNTDVAPEKNFLEPLIEHFDDERIFAVGCMDKSIEKSKAVLRGRGIGRWQKGFLVHQRGEVGKNDTLWVSGGSGSFRKFIWDKLSGFNELYSPFYWEDIDLSYRALKSGYKIQFEPKSIVVHEHEKGSIKSKYSDYEIKVVSYRNQFIFVWENATDFDLQILHILWLPYHLIMAILRLDSAFFLGFFRALILFPKIIKSSFRAQKLFSKTDREITEFIE